MKIMPAGRIHGRVTVPGDKSISHRAAIIAALAPGRSRLENFSSSQDCGTTLECLRALGVSIQQQGNTVTVEGRERWQMPSQILDCGNSGSTMRMLAGVLAGHNFSSILTGDASLRSRPMGRVIEPIEKMGAKVESIDRKPPLSIIGGDVLTPIDFEMSVASAQVKSCVLFAGMRTKGQTTVLEQQVTRDHTERMFNWFGVPVTSETVAGGASRISICGPVVPTARDVSIPGDISSAAFFIAGAALIPGSDLEIAGVGINPTRTQFITTLQLLGLDVKITGRAEVSNEPVGNVRVGAGARLASSTAGQFNHLPEQLVPQLIDELPLLAVVATQIEGGIAIRGSSELRLKESDRIAATVKNLRAMGADVEEFDDGLSVAGPQRLRGAELDSFGDHRIAMAFTIAALLADEESFIVGAESVSISFPEFFHMLESIVEY